MESDTAIMLLLVIPPVLLFLCIIIYELYVGGFKKGISRLESDLLGKCKHTSDDCDKCPFGQDKKCYIATSSEKLINLIKEE